MLNRNKILIPKPELQIDFSFALAKMRKLCLQEALSETIKGIKIPEIDKELASLVPQEALSALAQKGLRGELLFSVPCVLLRNPMLLGYYRLLLGFSQKAFYSSEFGLSSFKNMELKGIISKGNEQFIPELCRGLIKSAYHLLSGIGKDRVSQTLLDDLTLLTLGPQFRGGANVKKGIVSILKVFEAILKIVKPYTVKMSPRKIEILNAAERKVFIEFAPDPDIIIREEMSLNSYRNIIAIEIKGGTDFSNIHNRIGEAEKSHQKARRAGYVECWTVVNVDRIDIKMAQRESPSTNQFYRISELESCKSNEYEDFYNRIVGLTGIPRSVR